MSFGTSPSTMTVDPTPPQLRPLQNQLVQMLMGRMSGQGKTSVPTYGSALGNVQQQLYGIDPRSSSKQVGGFGPPPTRAPTGPRYGPGGNMPTFGDTQRPPMLPAGPMLGEPPSGPGGVTAIAPPVLTTPGEYTGPRGYYNGAGQWQNTGGVSPIGDPSPMNLHPTDLTKSFAAPPVLMDPGTYTGPQGYYNAGGQWQSTGGPPPMDFTRGGPGGSMQGSSSPWAMPTFGSVMNGSGLIRANSSPYGYRYF